MVPSHESPRRSLGPGLFQFAVLFVSLRSSFPLRSLRSRNRAQGLAGIRFSALAAREGLSPLCARKRSRNRAGRNRVAGLFCFPHAAQDYCFFASKLKKANYFFNWACKSFVRPRNSTQKLVTCVHLARSCGCPFTAKLFLFASMAGIMLLSGVGVGNLCLCRTTSQVNVLMEERSGTVFRASSPDWLG